MFLILGQNDLFSSFVIYPLHMNLLSTLVTLTSSILDVSQSLKALTSCNDFMFPLDALFIFICHSLRYIYLFLLFFGAYLYLCLLCMITNSV